MQGYLISPVFDPKLPAGKIDFRFWWKKTMDLESGYGNVDNLFWASDFFICEIGIINTDFTEFLWASDSAHEVLRWPGPLVCVGPVVSLPISWPLSLTSWSQAWMILWRVCLVDYPQAAEDPPSWSGLSNNRPTTSITRALQREQVQLSLPQWHRDGIKDPAAFLLYGQQLSTPSVWPVSPPLIPQGLQQLQVSHAGIKMSSKGKKYVLLCNFLFLTNEEKLFQTFCSRLTLR